MSASHQICPTDENSTERGSGYPTTSCELRHLGVQSFLSATHSTPEPRLLPSSAPSSRWTSFQLHIFALSVMSFPQCHRWCIETPGSMPCRSIHLSKLQ